MQRRTFVLGAAAFAAEGIPAMTATTIASPAQDTPRPNQPLFSRTLSDPQREQLREYFKTQSKNFDAKENLLVVQIGGAYNYNTNLRNTTGYPTRESLAYAVNLLDTNDKEHEERAFAVLRRILEVQDTDPNSASFGVWPHYANEPLTKAPYVDRNWADFLGVLLLEVMLYHRHRLPDDLRKPLETGIRNAAFAVRKRNVGPGYTNIAVMSTYVTLMTGEAFGDTEWTAHGLERLKRFHTHSKEQGAFTEFNSPTYTIVALKEIARLRQHIRHPDAKPMIEDIYRMAWEEIAEHFHPPTRQWAGPHSRTYRTLLDNGVLSLIERETGGKAKLGLKKTNFSPDDYRTPAPCPPDLIGLFAERKTPRTVVKRFIRDSIGETIGSTHLTPTFALGSINRGTLWNQARPLLLYFGTAEAPSYLAVRLLHDDYDLATGRIFSVQQNNTVLTAIILATDGGDKHPSLDKIKDGTLTISDLRLRFEIGGAPAKSVRATDKTIQWDLNGIPAMVTIATAQIGQLAPEINTTVPDKPTSAEIVFYKGELRPFRLADWERAVIVFGFQVGTSEQETIALTESDGMLKATSGSKTLTVPVKPAPANYVLRSATL